MASEDTKGKKRKAAVDAQPKPKKQKKSNETATAPKKPAKATKAAVEPIDSLSTKVRSSRKRAEDFFSDDEAPEETHTTKKKKSKKSDAEPVNGSAQVSDIVQKPKKTKKDKTNAVETVLEPEAPKEQAKKSKKAKKSTEAKGKEVEVEIAVAEEVSGATETKKPKKSKKSKKQEEAPVEVAETVVEARDADEGEDLDDQTAALLAGFESDRDESDLEKEDEGISEEAVEKLPNLSKKQRKALEKIRKDAEPGVIFLGRIPHGFFEPQMKSYFSQFGAVTRLRLSRNKKTGASKHYAFIEFANADVADIVAKTMQNYLMFGHILQCKTIPPEQVHADLFKGANERFKVDPRNKKQGSSMARGAERAVWEKRVGNENKRRVRKARSLKNEFDYEFSAPAVKAVGDVPKKISAVEDGPTQQLLTEAAAPQVTEVVQITESKPDHLTVTETVKVKKPRKNAKGKGQVETEVEVDQAVVAEPVQASKAKKDKKRKSDAVAEIQTESELAADAPAPKSKKTKKAKKAVV